MSDVTGQDQAKVLVVPVLDSYDDGEVTKLWCDFCVRWHTHGVGDGDRAAHCTFKESPYKRTGYVTRSVGPWTDEVEAMHADEMKRAAQAFRVWQKLRGPYDKEVSWRDVYEGRLGSVGGQRRGAVDSTSEAPS